MAARGQPAVVTRDEPPYEVSGMVTMTLDPSGLLRSLRVVPPQVEPASAATATAPDWGRLFAEAGLDIASFVPAEPVWLSPSPFDARAAWTGRLPGGGEAQVQIMGAAYRGRPVSFEIFGPWSRPSRMGERPRSFTARLTSFVEPGLFGGVIILGVVFARRNIRLGRGDRRGAFRLFVFVCAIAALERTLSTHHVAEDTLLAGVFVWLTYLALEPYVRRRWPNLLISWSRLLSGRVRDPLVGRDVLAGSVLGAACALNLLATQTLPWFVSVPGETPLRTRYQTLRGVRHLLANLLDAQVVALLFGLLVVTLLFLSHLVLRKRWLALLVTGLVIVALNAGAENPWLEIPAAVVFAVLVLTALLRTGVLGLVLCLLVSSILADGPLTFDASHWYAGHGWFLAAVALAIVAWGFHTSLGGRPLFGGAALDD
jgi:hypothetical protein